MFVSFRHLRDPSRVTAIKADYAHIHHTTVYVHDTCVIVLVQQTWRAADPLKLCRSTHGFFYSMFCHLCFRVRLPAAAAACENRIEKLPTVPSFSRPNVRIDERRGGGNASCLTNGFLVPNKHVFIALQSTRLIVPGTKIGIFMFWVFKTDSSERDLIPPSSSSVHTNVDNTRLSRCKMFYYATP